LYNEFDAISPDGNNVKREILLIDDNEAHRELIKASLAHNFLEIDISEATDGLDAVEMLKEKNYDLIILDFMMPWVNGLEFLELTKDMRKETPLVMISGSGNHTLAPKAFSHGVTNYLEKDLKLTENLVKTVATILDNGDMCAPKKGACINSAESAIEILKEYQKELLTAKVSKYKEEILIMEFNDSEEFNKFSKLIMDIKNVKIKDIHVVNERYITMINVFPKSYDKIT
jgi:CheY-like chemotaxis protein